MVVVYLYGEYVFARVSIKYILKSFEDLDKAVRLISERIGLSFELSVDQFGCKIYNCTDYTKDIKIIAELTKVL